MASASARTIAEVAPTLADLRKLPLARQSLLLLERLSVLYPQMESAGGLHKGNLLLPNDPYGLATGYRGTENLEVRRHLLGAPWTILVNRGYLVDPGGNGFYSVSDEGYHVLKNPKRLAAQQERIIRPTISESHRTIPPKKAITILEKLLGESMVLPGEPFASPKRSQWKETARGALEQAGVSDSLLQSFDASQSMVFSTDTSDEDMRKMSNSNLAEMTAVLNSAIEQLGWQIDETEPRAEPRKEPQRKGPVKSTGSTFDVNDHHFLIVDGEVWIGANVSVDGEYGTTCFFEGKNVPKVANLSFEDLAGYFDEIEILFPDADRDPRNWDFASIDVQLWPGQDKRVEVAFRVDYHFDSWARQYSISDIATILKQTLPRSHTPFVYWEKDDDRVGGFGVSIRLPLESTVQEALNKRQDLKKLVLLIGDELSAAHTTAVNLAFDFPAPIKNACEQYLLYFVQFLSDLGIEANAEIKEQASRVLFSVTPVDEKQALGKITEALRVYLGLPLAPEFAMAASQFHDVAVSQLQANVLHLQSQVMLAKAAIEMKNATLDAKDAHIALLQERIDLNVFQPQPRSKGTDAGKEELVKDVVSVKKWDYKFLEINFPELLRKLKRTLK